MKQRKAWEIPELWPGRTVFIIGGGPSLKGVSLDCLKGERVIGVNVAFKYYPFVDIVYFGDCGIYPRIKDDLKKFGGIKISSCGRVPEVGRGWPGILRVSRGKPSGIDRRERNKIAWNGNSGASAINIAYWLGAKKIVLLGFDMQRTEEKNFHQDYLGNENHDFNPFPRYLKNFPIIAADAKKINIEILNATPNSAIKDFPIVALKDTII